MLGFRDGVEREVIGLFGVGLLGVELFGVGLLGAGLLDVEALSGVAVPVV
jgi:hypothetical protein